MMVNKTRLRVFSALAVRAPFVLLEQEWGKTHSDISLEIEWNPTSVIEKKIAQGETADAVILTKPAMDTLIEAGLISPTSIVELVDSHIGLAMLPDATAPDISTTALLIKALLAARSVAYSQGGASGIYLIKLLESLGIKEEFLSRATAIPEGFTATKLIDGSADIAIQQISELLSVEGVKVIGPLPKEVQKVTSFQAGIFSQAEQPAAASTFLKYLRSQQAQTEYEKFGLQVRT